ncbi:MAG TPA: anti-sigma factor [Solirubrobacterales bacterium]|nr:anti-sigma factor [Solirubrobacterales bacterium]
MSHDRGEPVGHESYRGDLAAYALGALEEPEAAELEGHLAECEACRIELRWLEPAVDLLPRSVEQLEPPAGLRKQLMATVRAEARDARPARIEASVPRRRAWGALIWRPATAVAAVGLLVAGGAVGYLVHQPSDSSSVVAARPSPSAPGNPVGTLDRSDGSAILTMSQLPALPAGDVYEVWVERDGMVEPSSLFVPRRDRTAEAAVPAGLDDADAVLVTREPRGGSQQPTSPPLLRADLD